MNTNTIKLTRDAGRLRMFRRRFALQVIQGPDAGQSLASANESVTVGTAQNNDLILSDSSVSRYHLRVEVSPNGFLLSDLDSTNGTTAGNLRLRQGVADAAVDLRLGETLLRFSPLAEQEEVPMLAADRFGEVLGQSPVMRELFRKLQSAASRDVTVLLEGATGTGKELIAEEVHRHSSRREAPFIIVDCGAIPTQLIESELFGHIKGAFTGATADRAGAFEEAHGGLSSSTRSASLTWPCSPGSCAPWRTGRSSGWGSLTTAAWTRGSSPPPTVTSSAGSTRGPFAPTSSTGWRWST